MNLQMRTNHKFKCAVYAWCAAAWLDRRKCRVYSRVPTYVLARMGTVATYARTQPCARPALLGGRLALSGRLAAGAGGAGQSAEGAAQRTRMSPPRILVVNPTASQVRRAQIYRVRSRPPQRPSYRQSL